MIMSALIRDTIESLFATYHNVYHVTGRHHLVEFSMSLIDHPAVYDDLLDVLAESADAERLLAFRLSEVHQARLDALLERNREGTLTHEEAVELDAYERFEHLVRLLKARVLQKQES
jgi:hypothetical protein